MNSWPMRVLVVGVVLLVVAALVVVIAAVPPAGADTFPLATPEGAVRGLWGNALLNVSAAAAALAASRVEPVRVSLRRALVAVAGVAALLLAAHLITTAATLHRHGPALRGAVAALRACAGCDLAGGIALLAAALGRRP